MSNTDVQDAELSMAFKRKLSIPTPTPFNCNRSTPPAHLSVRKSDRQAWHRRQNFELEHHETTASSPPTGTTTHTHTHTQCRHQGYNRACWPSWGTSACPAQRPDARRPPPTRTHTQDTPANNGPSIPAAQHPPKRTPRRRSTQARGALLLRDARSGQLAGAQGGRIAQVAQGPVPRAHGGQYARDDARVG